MTQETPDQVREATLEVPGATLHYQRRGSGPVLLVIPGGWGDSGMAAALAPLLAQRYTVVTYDPRGLGRSRLHDAPTQQRMDVHADDVHRLLTAVTDQPADILAISGGGLPGLDLAAAHPEQVRTLVLHEPPITELLPEREQHRKEAQEVDERYQREGALAAAAAFLSDAGLDGGDDEHGNQEEQDSPGGPDPEMLGWLEGMRPNLEFFFGYLWKGMEGYLPDFDRLCAVSPRIVVAIGEQSQGQVAHRTASALAERLGTSTVTFPGDHGGFFAQPAPFAQRLQEVLG